MKFYKLLLLISFFYSNVYPCGACHSFAMGNVPLVPYRLMNPLLKVPLKVALHGERTHPSPVLTCRSVTLLNSDDLAEIIVDVGTSVMYSQKFTGGFCPLTLAVAAKQTFKVVAREKTIQALTFAAQKTQEATGLTLPTLNEDPATFQWPAVAVTATAAAARTAIRFGLDYCLDSAEAWLIHKVTKRR